MRRAIQHRLRQRMSPRGEVAQPSVGDALRALRDEMADIRGGVAAGLAQAKANSSYLAAVREILHQIRGSQQQDRRIDLFKALFEACLGAAVGLAVGLMDADLWSKLRSALAFLPFVRNGKPPAVQAQEAPPPSPPPPSG